MARKDLLNSMTRFEKDMEKCAAWAHEIESQFDGLVKCASEVNSAMAEKLCKYRLENFFGLVLST